MDNFPHIKLRRLRQNSTFRKMFGMPFPPPEKFIYPVFIIEGTNRKVSIKSMPNQYRYSIDKVSEAIEPLVKIGISGIMLFGVLDGSEKKTDNGSEAYNNNGLIQKAVKIIRSNFPGLTVCTDVCLCGYTNHGHCGIVDSSGNVLNDKTLDILSKIAVSHAEAGAHCVAPSAMMDGQVQSIRRKLHHNNFDETVIMSYSTKFASSMYGPFREAAESAPAFGDRKTYQLSYNNTLQAIRESKVDENEGADILMVKPALFYLDIINRIKDQVELPLAVYNVSGEYSMIYASAQLGYGDLYEMANESVTAIFRAGADVVLSYWANQYDKLLEKSTN
jgi:porphobilinogen synthase